MRRTARTALRVVCATWYRVRSRNRIQGRSFLLRRPDSLDLSRGARVVIGRGTVIEAGARIVARGRLEIGEGVYIGKDVTLVAFGDLVIGDRALLAERVSVHTEDHGPAGDRLAYAIAPVTIGPDVWLGAGVVVTRGSVIGARTTVGANAVVTRDLPDDVLAVGVPAKVVRSLAS